MRWRVGPDGLIARRGKPYHALHTLTAVIRFTSGHQHEGFTWT